MAGTRKGAVVAVGLVLAAAQPGHAQQRSAVGDLLGNLFGTAPSTSPAQAVLMPDFRQTLVSNFGQRNVSAQDMQTAIGMLAQSLATGQPLYNANPQGVRIGTTVGALTGNGCRNAAIELRRAGNTGQADIRANTVACWTGQAWMTQGGGMTGQLPSPGMAQAPASAFRPVQQAQQPQPGRGVTVSDQVDELRTMRVRTPLREMPDQASRSLGNLIENSKVSMTGHVAGMPGWVRISTNGKVGYTLEGYLNPLDQQQAAQQPPAAPARPFTPTPPTASAEVLPPPPWPVLEQVPPVAVPAPVQQIQQAVPPPIPAPAPVTVPAPVQAIPVPVQQVIAPAAPLAPVQAPAPAPVAVEAPRAPVVAQAPQEAPRTAQAAPAAPAAAASPAAPPAPPAPPPRRRVDSAL